jgi:hypothetical protein
MVMVIPPIREPPATITYLDQRKLKPAATMFLATRHLCSGDRRKIITIFYKFKAQQNGHHLPKFVMQRKGDRQT